MVREVQHTQPFVAAVDSRKGGNQLGTLNATKMPTFLTNNVSQRLRYLMAVMLSADVNSSRC